MPSRFFPEVSPEFYSKFAARFSLEVPSGILPKVLHEILPKIPVRVLKKKSSEMCLKFPAGILLENLQKTFYELFNNVLIGFSEVVQKFSMNFFS